jgi:hypothetical protein
VTLPLLVALAEAEITFEGIPAPYDEDWKLMVRCVAREMEGKSLADCHQVAADAILVRDYLHGGDADISASTQWSNLVEVSRAWIAEQEQDEDLQVEPVERAGPEDHASRVAVTPGGMDIMNDAQTGLQVVRLTQFPQFVQESDLMRHCIGRSQAYFNKHLNGTGAFYSFRQPGEERPLATLELVQFNGEWRIAQCRGPFNHDPGQGCHDMAERLREAHQLGGEIRTASYEVFAAQPLGARMELERTSANYF